VKIINVNKETMVFLNILLTREWQHRGGSGSNGSNDNDSGGGNGKDSDGSNGNGSGRGNSNDRGGSGSNGKMAVVTEMAVMARWQ
jgi:hypothetical protein